MGCWQWSSSEPPLDPPLVILSFYCLCRVYNIGIDVMQGKGQFRNTNIVTFAPRYEIDNQSGHKLAISQRHFTSKEVGSGKRVAWWKFFISFCRLLISWPQVLHAGKKFIFFCRLLISWPQVLHAGKFFIIFLLSAVSFFQDQFFWKISFRNATRVSNILEPVQARHSVEPDLGPNCLQRLSAEDTGR